MTDAAEKIADGDLAVEVRKESDDEFGRLAEAFQGSVSYLHEMADAAERVAEGNLTVEIKPRSDAGRAR